MEFDFDGFFSVFAGLLIVFLLIFIGFLVFYLVGLYKLYRKAGKAGWECIVPFYSTYVLVEIAGLNWWWFLIVQCSSIASLFNENYGLSLMFSGVSLLGNAVVCYNLSKKFNKDTAWFVLSIFFSGITFPLLGYSNNNYYYPNVPVSKNGFFGPEPTNQPNNGQTMYNQQPYNNGQQMYNQQPFNNGQQMYNQQQNNNGYNPNNNGQNNNFYN